MRRTLIDVSLALMLACALTGFGWLAGGFLLCTMLACREGDE
jgi:hypothetical protein